MANRKGTILLGVTIFLSLTINGAEIDWFDNYDEALAAARAEKKNMFILITAPSWCGWCVKLEEDVLSKAAFKDYLSENYIGLKLLDKVNDQRNPELARFDFSGFPTVYLYDYEGNHITDSYTLDINQMLKNLENNVSARGKFRPSLADLKLPRKFVTLDNKGEYINNEDGTWTVNLSGEEVIYKQDRYDFKYLYLSHPSDGSVIALSMSGRDAHEGINVDGKWAWTNLANVKRIGGDPYFE
jgi:protein disulfide-isomerase